MSRNPAESVELIRCGYERCCAAYETAVDVSKFTWKMFYTGEAAVFGAAGYLAVTHPEAALVSAMLLAFSAVMTWRVTWPQMLTNQRVIRKVIAAGAHLEHRNPELGCRFKIDAFGDELRENLAFRDLWLGPADLEARTAARLGLTPKAAPYCYIFLAAEIVFSVVALWVWFARHEVAVIRLPVPLPQ